MQLAPAGAADRRRGENAAIAAQYSKRVLDLRAFLDEHDIPPCEIVAAVSGGVDSTALLLALEDLRGEGFAITGAHVNHHLRGEESDGDEQFVRELCAQLAIDVRVADGTLDPERIRARGIEAAAREVRYARLAEIREDAGARWVATAHQKDDQAETVLMRLLTGTGISGLRGIHPIRDDGFIRPLLDVTRDELAAFVASRGITPRHDGSNDDQRFLRNRVRGIVRELSATESLAAVAKQARLQWPLVERLVDDAENVIAQPDETRFVSWPEDAWLRQALLHRHIRRLDPSARDVSASDLVRLAATLETIKRVSVTKSLELVREGDALALRRVPEPTPEFELELAAGASAYIPEIDRTIAVAEPTNRAGAQRFQLPDRTPLFTIRNRRRGDRFQPLGLTTPKKLKDFLIDRKIAAGLRDRLPLLLWNGEIVWIPGVEVSERFKVTDPTGAVFEAWLEGSGERDHSGLQR